MSHIAIIGSGPAGCYLADSLLRLMPDASIDIVERLPVPFGLVRYGVAPDHQSTKGVIRVLDRVLSRDRVTFFGNVEVGRDVKLEELMGLYDAVVLATGASRDRRLGIAGDDLPGVMGSGAFVSWYNSHPDAAIPPVQQVRSAVIIGNGNVALDVARILAKDHSELAGSDLPPAVMAWLASHPITDIHIVGRRGAADARFSEHELAELGTLSRARPFVHDAGALTADTPVIRTLLGFAADRPTATPVTIHFHFNLVPLAFTGDSRLQAVQFRTAEGSVRTIAADLAVTCIGYESIPCCTATPSNGVFAGEEGRVRERLYVVGWAKRGPSGTIPTNRTEAQQVAQCIAAEVTDSRPGGSGLRRLLEERALSWVDYPGWRRIDAAELAGAGEKQCRQKFQRIEDMLAAARSGELSTRR